MNLLNRSALFRIGAFAVVALLLAHEAFAWGPRSKRAIAAAAITQVRRDAGEIFLAGGRDFEADMLRGAEEGLDLLAEFNSFDTEEQAIDAIMNEIVLLRGVRKRGVGSYFAFRLGALSALVSQVMTPYGFPSTPQEREIYARLASDVEKHVHNYAFDPRAQRISVIENPESFFSKQRPFWQDDLATIREEYERGVGYEGFLDQAAPSYFQRAAEAVAAAWKTIIHDRVRFETRPHTSALTEYYTDEIRYQLDVKKNIAGADRAYRDFVAVNNRDMDRFIKVGDLYYAYDTPESRERAVHEWKVAYRIPGSQSRVAAKRLAKHFIEVGEMRFNRAQTPEALDSDLEDALRAFETALEFDGTNERAATLVSKTTNAIIERRELYDEQQLFIDNAAVIMENAERSLFQKDYADALSSYQQALTLVDRVGAEFTDLQEQAQDMASDLRKGVKSSISEIFAVANEKIVEGDQLSDDGDYEQALNVYRSAESILGDVPDEEGTIEAERKAELEEVLMTKIDETEVRMKAAESQPAARGRR